MPTAPGRHSTTVHSLRLYVYIRITQLPAVVEVEFPEEKVQLAQRGRHSTTVHSLRLYVYIRITRLPAVVEVEFPEEKVQLAQRYRESISDTKILPPVRQKPHVVAFELPNSVIELETSKSLRSFLLHFDTARDATKFGDAICFPLKGYTRQVFIKQDWGRAEVARLEESLPMLAPVVVERSTKPPDRAGTPPGQAMGSRSYN
ncbi:hypothetical protein V498_01484 [Pseudogymnoascus sp. VKM F-4517 (FW-2822)]|nr:hypothetical protein V498_01484 [Pseudogymnoascus sp. VKM F-4517 (FW-2822)]